MKKNRKKTVATKIVAMLLALTLIITAIPINSMATTAIPESDATVITEAESQEIIETVDDAVIVNDEGLIEVEEESTKEILDLVGQENYKALLDSLEIINTYIEKGELEATANGTIYEPNDDELVVQGGNVYKNVWKWWGIRMYRTQAQTKVCVKDYRRLANGSAGVATASKFVAIFIPSGSGKLAAALVSVGGSALGWYANKYANSMEAKNNPRGIIIDFTWILAFKVKSQ